jgi:hypothetical protein
MAGNTAVICVQKFSADWASSIPVLAICERYSISRDQVRRLCVIWNLPPRKGVPPPRTHRPEAPTRAEDEASGRSCDLAPAVAKRVAELRYGAASPRIKGSCLFREDGSIPAETPVIAKWRDSVREQLFYESEQG